jgi:hypothetical protein
MLDAPFITNKTMIRTFITPMQSNFTVALEFPDEYLGEELELIVFKKEEGLIAEKKSQTTKLSDKYKGAFTKEDAKSFDTHTKQMRKEWDNT